MSALRYNQDKNRIGLVPASLERYVGAALTYGSKKYEPNNWRKGFPWSSVLDSLCRHLNEFKDGGDFDEESGLPLLALIGCNVAFLIEHFDAGLGVDDRVRVPSERMALRWKEPPAPAVEHVSLS